MIKIVLGVVLVVLVGYVGYGIERYYNTRLKILADYKNFLKYAERETAFLKTSIDELVDRFESATEELKKLLNEALGKDTGKDKRVLGEGCQKEITGFIKELSKSDYSSIGGVISSAMKRCNEMLEQAEKDKIQKGELSRKIIILVGIGLIIIIL